MAVDLICPDCGGVIGATEIDSEGRAPCTCVRETESPSSRDSSSDTVSIPAQREAERSSTIQAEEPSPAKLCIRCGKDVTGHRRVKDSRGYMCYACSKEEMQEEKAGTIPCGACKRRVKEAGLYEYKGRRICKICLDHEKEIDRKNRKVSTKHLDEHEKRNVMILGAVFAVLALIILTQLIRHLLH